MASKGLGPLPRMRGSALAHGCGRGGRGALPLARAFAVSTRLGVHEDVQVTQRRLAVGATEEVDVGSHDGGGASHAGLGGDAVDLRRRPLHGEGVEHGHAVERLACELRESVRRMGEGEGGS